MQDRSDILLSNWYTTKHELPSKEDAALTLKYDARGYFLGFIGGLFWNPWLNSYSSISKRSFVI